MSHRIVGTTLDLTVEQLLGGPPTVGQHYLLMQPDLTATFVKYDGALFVLDQRRSPNGMPGHVRLRAVIPVEP